MSENISRRKFIKNTAVSTAAVLSGSALFKKKSESLTMAQNRSGEIKKSLYYGMLPRNMSVMGKFRVAKRTGFEGIEIPTLEKRSDVDEFKEAAESSGVKIHSIMNASHWKYPFSSADPQTAERSIEGMETSLRNAKALGASTVLLVPAVVNPETSYKDAYIRSQERIRKLLPLAKELNVVIAVENVWNKFLLSPLEFARYVDEIDSPYLKAYFDCGNILLYGYPQDWIRTLGKRIVKIHIKGYDSKSEKRGAWVNLGEGTVDWIEVRRALKEIGYTSYMTAELRGGDEDYLTDVSRRMDKIIAGEKI